MWSWICVLSLSCYLFSSLFVCKYWGEKIEKPVTPTNFFWTGMTFLPLNNCIMLLFCLFLSFSFGFICRYICVCTTSTGIYGEEDEIVRDAEERRAASIWATVSFCCQSLIAKEHIHFSSRTGKYLCFMDFASLLFFFFFLHSAGKLKHFVVLVNAFISCPFIATVCERTNDKIEVIAATEKILHLLWITLHFLFKLFH